MKKTQKESSHLENSHKPHFTIAMIILLFLLSTAYLCYQHYLGISWDFSAFVNGAKYWFGNGRMIEPGDPPITAFLIGMLSFGGWAFAEYAFIVFSSAMLLISSVRFAKTTSVHPALFYALMLSPFTLRYGTFGGSEIIALSFLVLFVSYVLEDSWLSGLFLGFAFLSRYNFGIFGVLLLFHKPKNIARALALFFLILIPWLAYNYVTWGSPLVSIADGYAMNYLLRSNYVVRQINIGDLIWPASAFVLLIVYGLVIALLRLILQLNKMTHRQRRVTLALTAVAIIGIAQYFSIYYKDYRYLFSIVLPFAFFSAVALDTITKNKQNKQKNDLSNVLSKNCLPIALTVLFTVLVTFHMHRETFFDTKEKYETSVEMLEELDISNCRIMSNAWPILNYMDITANPYPRIELLDDAINRGDYVLLLYVHPEPDYLHDNVNGKMNGKKITDKYPVIAQSNSFVLIGKKGSCNQPVSQDRPFYEEVNERTLVIYGKPVETDPCRILFGYSFAGNLTCAVL